MSLRKHRYSDIAPYLDVDAFEEAIGWAPEYTKDENDVGFCPDLWGLHKNGDTSGKFAIHRNKRVFNCWVCGGGSLLSLAMAFKEISEPDAIDWLGEFVDGDEDEERFASEIDRLLAQEQRSEKAVLPWFNPKVLEQWAGNLSDCQEWLDERGILAGVAREAKLGYDPQAKRITKKGTYVGPGIVFPHFWEDRLVGWQHRWLNEDRPKWIPKYTNTTDFPKSTTIYNYERVYLSEEPIVVVESVPTVLYLAGSRVPAMGTFGSSVTEDQMKLLRRCQQGLILAPDNDGAGRKFATSLTKYLEDYIPLWVAEPVGELDSGDDLADVDPEQIPCILRDAHYIGMQ